MRPAVFFTIGLGLVACGLPDTEVTIEGPGGGVVRSSTGRTCTRSCALPFGTLIAEPDRFSSTAGFFGSGCRGTGECLPRDGNAVTVTFDAVAWPLTISVAGKGVVEGPGFRLTESSVVPVAVGSMARLVATAQAGSLFDRWTGACEGSSASTCEVAPTGPLSVGAQFQEGIPYTVEVDGEGTVEVAPLVTCAGRCDGIARRSVTVTLNAQPKAGHLFMGWNHPCGLRNPCEFSLEEPLRVRPKFRPFITIHSDGERLGRFASPSLRCPSFPCRIAWEGAPVGFEVLTQGDAWFDGFTNCPTPTANGCTIDRYVPEIRFSTRQPILEVDAVQSVRVVKHVSGGADFDVAIVNAQLMFELRRVVGPPGNYLVQLSKTVTMTWAHEVGPPMSTAGSIVGAAARQGGGVVVAFEGPLRIGPFTEPGYKHGVVAFSSSGAVDWSYGFAEMTLPLGALLRDVAVDEKTGTVYVLGYRFGTADLPFGASTISSPPPSTGRSVQFVGALSASGQPRWAKPTVLLQSGLFPSRVLASPTGPVVFARTDVSDPAGGCAATPSVGTGADFLHVIRHSPTGACPPASGIPESVVTSSNEQSGTLDQSEALYASDQEGFIATRAMRACSEAAAPSGVDGAVIARLGRSYPPENRVCRALPVACGDPTLLKSIGAGANGDLVVTGSAPCVRDVTAFGPERAFVGVWNPTSQKFVRAWQFPAASTLLAASTVSPTETVLWVSTESPFTMQGRAFAPPPRGQSVAYRVRIRH